MNIGVIGLGLMGASFARTIKKKTNNKVYGTDRDSAVILKASLIGAIDEELTHKNAQQLDMLIISIPPRGVSDILSEYIPLLKKGCTVLDFCGIKREICSLMSQKSKEYPNLFFFGGHPMAGREYSGIDHSVTTLFDNASMLIVPISSDIFNTEKVKTFFIDLGFKEVVFTNPELHDSEIAFTSQMCHVVSNAFIKSPAAITHHGYSAGSYKDLTRVAKLDSRLWSSLMIDNRDKLLHELNIFIQNIQKYKTALENADEEDLQKLLEEGNRVKISIDARGKK